MTLTCIGFILMFLKPNSSNSALVYGPAQIPMSHQPWMVSVNMMPCSYADSMLPTSVGILAVSLSHPKGTPSSSHCLTISSFSEVYPASSASFNSFSLSIQCSTTLGRSNLLNFAHHPGP